jgi:multiple sugar transport system substrate-binding protein
MNGITLNRRAFLRTMGAAGAGLVLSACAPATAPAGGAPAAPAAEAATITLWGWWDMRMAIYNAAGQSFMEANPDVTVLVETLPGGELEQKVYSALAAGTGPNMLKMAEFFFRMREEELLLPFPDDIFPDSWFKEVYPSVDWDAYGRYVVPTSSCGTILVYNKAMFEEAGLDPESPPTTWDAFIEAAKATTQSDASGITRCGFVPSEEYPGLSQVYQQGGNIIDISGDAQTATITSPEVERAFQHLADLALVHKVWDPTFPDNIESVGTGLAAMTEDQAWIIGEFTNTYADIYPNLGFAPNPTPTGEPDPYYGYKSTVLSVSALSGHEDQAPATFRFLEHLYQTVGKDIYMELAQLLSCAPARADLVDDPRLQENPGLAMVAQVIPYEKDPVQPPPEMYDLWLNTLQKMVMENEPAAVALAQLNTDVQALVDQGLAKYLR